MQIEIEQAAFERALFDNRDDALAWGMYADWLMEQGDARGELIHIQLQLEAESGSGEAQRELKRREEDLLAENVHAWLGLLAKKLVVPGRIEVDELGLVVPTYRRQRDIEFWFRRGFLHGLFIPWDCLPEIANELHHERETRFLHGLQLASSTRNQRSQVLRGVRSTSLLAESPFISELRELRIEPLRIHPWDETSTAALATLPALLRKCERLECLTCQLDPAALSVPPQIVSVEFPHLRELLISDDWYGCLPLVAENRSLSKLEALEVNGPPGASFGDDVISLVWSRYLPKLTELAVAGSNLGDDNLPEILTSPILQQLEKLSLEHANITDRGVELLANAELPLLQEVHLRNNPISDRAVRRLQDRGWQVLR